MDWLNKVRDQVAQSVEFSSIGGMVWRLDSEGRCLMLAPGVQEISGGPDDGAEVYPFYTLDVSAFVEIFDEPPEMHWDNMRNEFSMEGKIGGEFAWIVFCREPFDGDKPREIIDPDGGIRDRN